MKRLTSLALLGAFALSGFAQSDIISADFNSGGIPNNFELINYDGMGFTLRSLGSDRLKYFSGLRPEKKWFVGEIDNMNGGTASAALSASRRDDPEKATDNWMITPEIDVTEGMLLRWDARSVHMGFPESYEVKITEGDSSNKEGYKTLFSTNGESYNWSTHFVDLKDYAGKKVKIAFVHNAQNCYLLAIDNLVIGQITDTKLVAENHSRHFADNSGNSAMDMRLFNYGKEVTLTKIFLEIGGTETATINNVTLPRASYIDLTLPMKLNENARHNYYVKCVTDAGETIELLHDAIWTASNERQLVVEKFTGAWCNACAKLTPILQRYEHHFGDEVIIAEPHYAYSGVNDDMTNDSYGGAGELVFREYPAMLYNRNTKSAAMHAVTRPKNLNPLYTALEEPVAASMQLQAVDINQIGLGRMVSYVTFDEDIDNSNDAYRICYAVIKSASPTAYSQQNGATMLGMADYSEFHILPGEIPADAMIHGNVPVGTCSPTGVEKSLPAEIKKGETYSHTYLMEFPSEEEGLRFVSYLLNTATGDYKILNASSTRDFTKEQKTILLKGADRVQVGNETTVKAYAPVSLENIVWKSSDESIATVENGVVKGVASGKVIISAQNGEDVTEKEIMVYDNEPIAIEMSASSGDIPGNIDNIETADADILVSGDNIIVTSKGNHCQIEVYSVDGVKYFGKVAKENRTVVSLAALPAGLYIVKCTENGISKAIKVVK